MHYLGGKEGIAQEIADIVNKHRKPNQIYYELFVGGASVLSRIKGSPNIASDAHPDLIALYIALQDGWIPPITITEDQYKRAKNGELAPYLRGFIGFGCSFGGKWFGGYARDNTTRNYALNAHNSLLKKFKAIKNTEFRCSDYRYIRIEKDSIVYLDPPYENTTSYSSLPKFNSSEFWRWTRRISNHSLVFISEYKAPEDFIPIKVFEKNTNLRDKSNKKIPVRDMLYVHKRYSPLF